VLSGKGRNSPDIVRGGTPFHSNAIARQTKDQKGVKAIANKKLGHMC